MMLKKFNEHWISVKTCLNAIVTVFRTLPWIYKQSIKSQTDMSLYIAAISETAKDPYLDRVLGVYKQLPYDKDLFRFNPDKAYTALSEIQKELDNE